MSAAFVFDFKSRRPQSAARPPSGGDAVVDRLFAEGAARSARLQEARRAKEEQELASLRRPQSPSLRPRVASPGPSVYENLYAQHFKREDTLQAKRRAAEQRERQAIDAARRENLPTQNRHPSPAKSVASTLHARAEINCMRPKIDLLNASRLSRASEHPRPVVSVTPLRDVTGRINFGASAAVSKGPESVAMSPNSRGSALPTPSEAAHRLFAEDATRKAKIDRLREVSLAREKAEIAEAKLRLKVEIQKSKPKENKRVTALLDAALNFKAEPAKVVAPLITRTSKNIHSLHITKPSM